jgi:predicted nucleotidyltransferase
MAVYVEFVIRAAQFLEAITAWATAQTSIQGAALVGSHARNAATGTSDVDLVILADDPQTFFSDRGWVETFGTVIDQNIEHYGKLVSLRVHYEQGIEVEFGFADPSWAAAPLDPGTREVMAGGIKVLFDRGGVMREVRPRE